LLGTDIEDVNKLRLLVVVTVSRRSKSC